MTIFEKNRHIYARQNAIYRLRTLSLSLCNNRTKPCGTRLTNEFDVLRK